MPSSAVSDWKMLRGRRRGRAARAHLDMTHTFAFSTPLLDDAREGALPGTILRSGRGTERVEVPGAGAVPAAR